MLTNTSKTSISAFHPSVMTLSCAFASSQYFSQMTELLPSSCPMSVSPGVGSRPQNLDGCFRMGFITCSSSPCRMLVVSPSPSEEGCASNPDLSVRRDGLREKLWGLNIRAGFRKRLAERLKCQCHGMKGLHKSIIDLPRDLHLSSSNR